ncbi:uncharacterized protein KY384_008121 [Bacidia gigantensis]|uniref:uncharacterized protein n=1 Tax=Bacidia gigantensis TaxID=2732470 RepID=UPI001D053E3D|nr:uncharacterized protein KY384_008121 [Bacidia gigantensis]KAG8526692.1 hypothetical protein KY384_008121 [Bacidia gigantensis]
MSLSNLTFCNQLPRSSWDQVLAPDNTSSQHWTHTGRDYQPSHLYTRQPEFETEPFALQSHVKFTSSSSQIEVSFVAPLCRVTCIMMKPSETFGAGHCAEADELFSTETSTGVHDGAHAVPVHGIASPSGRAFATGAKNEDLITAGSKVGQTRTGQSDENQSDGTSSLSDGEINERQEKSNVQEAGRNEEVSKSGVQRDREQSGQPWEKALHQIEAQAPSMEGCRALKPQKCMVKIGRKKAFGDFFGAYPIMARVSLYPGPNGPPTITLTLRDQDHEEFYRSDWKMNAHDGFNFAVSDFEAFRVKDNTNDGEVSDKDVIEKWGFDHLADLICIRFTSWPLLDGFAKDYKYKDSVGQSLKTQLGFLRSPRSPFPISIWFPSPMGWVSLHNRTMLFFLSAELGRERDLLWYWGDSQGRSFLQNQATSEENSEEESEQEGFDEPEALWQALHASERARKAARHELWKMEREVMHLMNLVADQEVVLTGKNRQMNRLRGLVFRPMRIRRTKHMTKPNDDGEKGRSSSQQTFHLRALIQGLVDHLQEHDRKVAAMRTSYKQAIDEL